jgi:hypothetical protein
MNLPQEPLGFRRPGFSPEFNATHTGILTSPRSSTPHGMPSLLGERSPTISHQLSALSSQHPPLSDPISSTNPQADIPDVTTDDVLLKADSR